MKHRRGFNPLGVMAAHRKALHRNMVTSLFRHERITTTKAKAMEIRRTAEKMITRAKVDSVHNRRIISGRLYDEGIVAKLFTNIGPRMKERKGGYTRILKLGERQGDAAPMVILELVDYKLDIEGTEKKAKKKEAKAKTKAEEKEKEKAKADEKEEKSGKEE
jgi:large subunit ribosomal protein L17